MRPSGGRETTLTRGATSTGVPGRLVGCHRSGLDLGLPEVGAGREEEVGGLAGERAASRPEHRHVHARGAAQQLDACRDRMELADRHLVGWLLGGNPPRCAVQPRYQYPVRPLVPTTPGHGRRVGLRSDTLLIHAARRPKYDTAAEPVRWSIERPAYDDQALAEIRAEAPEGWVLLWVRSER